MHGAIARQRAGSKQLEGRIAGVGRPLHDVLHQRFGICPLNHVVREPRGADLGHRAITIRGRIVGVVVRLVNPYGKPAASTDAWSVDLKSLTS